MSMRCAGAFRWRATGVASHRPNFRLAQRLLACHPNPLLVHRALSSKADPPPPRGEQSQSSPEEDEAPQWLWFAGAGTLFAVGLAIFALGPIKGSALPPTTAFTPLYPDHYVELPVIYSTPTSDDTKLITVEIPPLLLPPSRPNDVYSAESVAMVQKQLANPIWHVWIKNPDMQIHRAYTPLEGITPDGRMTFWVRKYDDGEMGRYLHGREHGDRLEIMGPMKTWPWEDGVWDEVVMISGGTGITPFIQLLHHTFFSGKANAPTEPPTKQTHFTLLHASRSPSALPPAPILHPLLAHASRCPEELSVKLFVDQLDNPSSPKQISYPAPDTESDASAKTMLASDVATHLAAHYKTPVASSEDSRKMAQHTLTIGRIDQNAIETALYDRPDRTWWDAVFGSFKTMQAVPPSEKKNVLFLVSGPDEMIAAIAGPLGRQRSQGFVGGVLGDMGFTGDSVRKLA